MQRELRQLRTSPQPLKCSFPATVCLVLIGTAKDRPQNRQINMLYEEKKRLAMHIRSRCNVFPILSTG